MSTHLGLAEDIGLQHVLQNALAVLLDKPIDSGRRDQVLDNLVEIFAEAARGSQAIQPQQLIFAIEHRSSFERFSFFYRHLNKRFGDQVPTRVKDARDVFQAVKDGERPSQAKCDAAAELVQSLLNSIVMQRALKPLIAPAEIAL